MSSSKVAFLLSLLLISGLETMDARRLTQNKIKQVKQRLGLDDAKQVTSDVKDEAKAMDKAKAEEVATYHTEHGFKDDVKAAPLVATALNEQEATKDLISDKRDDAEKGQAKTPVAKPVHVVRYTPSVPPLSEGDSFHHPPCEKGATLELYKPYSTQACAALVAADNSCGNAFTYGGRRDTDKCVCVKADEDCQMTSTEDGMSAYVIQAPYQVGFPGTLPHRSISCPDGYFHIATMSECTAAVAAGVLELSTEVGDGTGKLKGCFYNQESNGEANVYFNTGEDGESTRHEETPLCKLRTKNTSCESLDKGNQAEYGTIGWSDAGKEPVKGSLCIGEGELSTWKIDHRGTTASSGGPLEQPCYMHCRDQKYKELDKQFAGADLNGDKWLDRSELTAFLLERADHVTDAEINKLLKAEDPDLVASQIRKMEVTKKLAAEQEEYDVAKYLANEIRKLRLVPAPQDAKIDEEDFAHLGNKYTGGGCCQLVLGAEHLGDCSFTYGPNVQLQQSLDLKATEKAGCV